MAEVESIPPPQQRLVYLGRIMSDTNTVYQYGLSRDATVAQGITRYVKGDLVVESDPDHGWWRISAVRQMSEVDRRGFDLYHHQFDDEKIPTDQYRWTKPKWDCYQVIANCLLEMPLIAHE